MIIPRIDARALFDVRHVRRTETLEQVEEAVTDIGFMTVSHTGITPEAVREVLATYHAFFTLPDERKRAVNMAQTGSNRGWGAPGAEQVDPAANPDYKQVFDSGAELSPDDPLARMTYYAPNRWPVEPDGFRRTITRYYERATRVSLQLLSAVATAIGEPADHFEQAFDRPMALLRGNHYPPRPADAGSADHGIAPHTDYGCLTLLATDGSPGLEVQGRDRTWMPVTAEPGVFVVNFGEMLETWSGGRVVATPHRVIGTAHERLSVPFFFNPRFDVDVAPIGSAVPLLAGDHLGRRYDETYTHRQAAR